MILLPEPAALGGTVTAAAPALVRASGRRSRATRLVRWFGPAVALLLFLLALGALRGELAAYGYHDVLRALRAIPAGRLLAAAAFTALSYAVFPAYDALALAYAGCRLSASRTVTGSVVAYGLSQTLGFPAFTGGAVRYRFWTAWGLSTVQIARAAAFAGLTFTVGVVFVSAVALLVEPAATLALLRVPAGPAHVLGGGLLAALGAGVVWCAGRGGRPLRVRGWEFPVPTARMAIAQLVVATLDWAAAAAVLYALLPPAPQSALQSAPLAFLPFAGLFVLAQTAGLVSHVPGGVGVFDTLIVLALNPYLAADRALGVLLAYRAIFYLVPFALALLALAAHEARQQRARLVTAGAGATAALRAVATSSASAAGRWGPGVLPTALGAATFAAGVVLLVSGATPGDPERETALARLVPLPVVELSHLLGSLAGAGLLVLAWALRRRLVAAYGLAVAALALGVVASLLKGFDYEEATVLALLLVVLLPFRRAFYRRTALTAEPFTPGWIVAVIAVLGTVAWVGLLSFRHVEYSTDLWWRFGPHADASRVLRAGVLSSGVLVAAGLLRLLRHARVVPAAPTAADVARAEPIAREAADPTANLALLGDKTLLFGPRGRGFVQYGVEGRSWVAMGGPVVAGDAAPDERVELAWAFRRLADAHGGWPVFYQVPADQLPLYIDMGLTLLKLGEEGRVPLRAFTLAGGGRKGLRRVVKEVEQGGGAFEVVPAEAVPALLPALRAVSDEWLRHKRVREKGFSLGYFDDAYLARFPVAVLRAPATDGTEAGRVVAFATVWAGSDRGELSVDLMRFVEDAPRGAMDYLFIRLMLWGQQAGYECFNLGMAPLAGVEAREFAPLWSRAGAWLFRHGEHFYNFQGLRQYKEKFDPVWTPRYLASPGGLVLPRVLANVATLVSGGVVGLVQK